MLLIRVLPPSWDQMKYLLPRNNKGKETSSAIFTALVLELSLVKPTPVAGTEPRHPICSRHGGSHTPSSRHLFFQLLAWKISSLKVSQQKMRQELKLCYFSAVTATISSGPETQQPFSCIVHSSTRQTAPSCERVPETAWGLKKWSRLKWQILRLKEFRVRRTAQGALAGSQGLERKHRQELKHELLERGKSGCQQQS